MQIEFVFLLMILFKSKVGIFSNKYNNNNNNNNNNNMYFSPESCQSRDPEIVESPSLDFPNVLRNDLWLHVVLQKFALANLLYNDSPTSSWLNKKQAGNTKNMSVQFLQIVPDSRELFW